MFKHMPAWVLVLLLAFNGFVRAQDGCATAFGAAQETVNAVYETAVTGIQDGVIAWQDDDWSMIVYQVVTSGEFYLNNCTDPDIPLTEQTDALDELAASSQLMPPVESVDMGFDSGDITLPVTFTSIYEMIDLNGDDMEELLLHTQVPYFSDRTVYIITGGLSIAYFYDEDGWQGQVIAPVTNFVTTEDGPHLSYSMLAGNTLSTEETHEALRIIPMPQVEVFYADETPLTAITMLSPTGAGTATELDIIQWDGRIPNVVLRVAFDDWCYPGKELNWEIREDGSVFVPSNGNEEGSPLHCGRTPEAVFNWVNGAYQVAQ